MGQNTDIEQIKPAICITRSDKEKQSSVHTMKACGEVEI
jgi:hypothetical protein